MAIDVDVDPVVLAAGPDGDTGRVPDCRPPDWVEVVIAREIQTSKHLPSDPLLGLHLDSVALSTALIELITRFANIAAQQDILLIRNESLEWIVVRRGGEVVSEEPGTESQLLIFHQGGVQQLSPAIFSWQ